MWPGWLAPLSMPGGDKDSRDNHLAVLLTSLDDRAQHLLPPAAAVEDAAPISTAFSVRPPGCPGQSGQMDALSCEANCARSAFALGATAARSCATQERNEEYAPLSARLPIRPPHPIRADFLREGPKAKLWKRGERFPVVRKGPRRPAYDAFSGLKLDC